MIPPFSSFVSLGFILFVLLSFPKHVADNIRSFSVASFIPAWKLADRTKNYITTRPWFGSATPPSTDELCQLQMEVLNLRSQLEIQSDYLQMVRQIEDQLHVLQICKEQEKKDFFKRRFKEVDDLLKRQLSAIAAPVIYRDPSSWSSSVWIQAGQIDNDFAGQNVIAKNSPVVVGTSLVGVVEFVGPKQSRVRLITDSGLVPSVRVARGSVQNREIGALAGSMLKLLSTRNDLPLPSQEKEFLMGCLQKLEQGTGGEDGYFAKGQLQGSSAPLWRARGLVLKGIGFNYDYSDQEGPSRDLRIGSSAGSDLPILREGDVLVTSGLDGVFPPGLKVAVIFAVGQLPEGGYSYEIEARPTVENLNDLRTVYVLPPLVSED